MAAKMAKDTQTDYTRGGKAISDTAIPLYQSNLNRMDDYLSNPTRSLDSYLDKYYTNTANQDDFMRAYRRNMANATAQNYSATSGGYTSSGQRAYDDQQRYMNDLQSRLRQQGISNAFNMATQDYQNMLNANNAYYNAYGLGKDYSDIERYNNMVNQNNSFTNQLGGIVGGIGKAASFIPGVGQLAGAALQTGGNIMSTDVSGLAGRLGAGAAQQAGSIGSLGDIFTNIGQGLSNTAQSYTNQGKENLLTRMFGY